jgi:hypothetical protein
MKKIISLIGVFSLLCNISFAQNEEDVLRYSNLHLIGTARYMGVAGAYGAIGADFSSLSSNPAGIGLYKKSDFSITPLLNFAVTESKYFGQTHNETKNNFAFGNAGFVLAFEPDDRLDRSPVRNFQIGFGINRLKDFNNNIYIQGVNQNNSYIDELLFWAGNKNPESLYAYDTRLAFNTYLIDTIPGEPQPTYRSAYDFIGGFTSAFQRKSVESSGSMNEWVLSGGMNVEDKLYFGLTLGFPRINFSEKSTYIEVNQTEADKDLDQFNYIDELETRGNGFNIKVGALARALPWLRVGVAYHSPTWYSNMTDTWRTRMNSRFVTYVDGQNTYNSVSPRGEFDYELQTPSKFIGSLAFMIGTMGFISADYERVNYGNGRLKPSIDYGTQNEVIKDNFTAANNFRVGTEWRLGLAQLRGGYANFGSPFKSGINDGQIQSFSAGLGFRTGSYYYDAAFVYSMYNMDYILYGNQEMLTMVPAAFNKYEAYTFLFTIGYRFD